MCWCVLSKYMSWFTYVVLSHHVDVLVRAVEVHVLIYLRCVVLSHHVDVLVRAVEVHVLVYLRCFESSRRCAGACCQSTCPGLLTLF